MGRGLGAGLVALGLVAACSSGGRSATPTTTTSTTTSTTAATTSTTSPEEAVKQAYLAYWKMADRLDGKPDPEDPELAQRTGDPLLSSVRDALATQASEGRVFVVMHGRPNDHQIRAVNVSTDSATLTECFIDGRSELDRSGQTIDDAVVSKLGQATLAHVDGSWKVTALSYAQRTQGGAGCPA